MSMLWRDYIYRRGSGVQDLWDVMFEKRPVRLLYISGRGFDVRAQLVVNSLVENLLFTRHSVERAELCLVSLRDYQLPVELKAETSDNGNKIEESFSRIGTAFSIAFSRGPGEDELSGTNILRRGVEQIVSRITNHTDIILDVSSLPRVVYLSILTGLLHRLIPDKTEDAITSSNITLQVVVAEDAALDSTIKSEDPSNDLVTIPGYSSALHAESVQDWPLVWFPILGENRIGQLQKVMDVIPESAEICPVVPHPSRDPRRADRLILEYKTPLFDARDTPSANIMYAHETHPFETYRQLLGAMTRYKESLSILGGCRLAVTPLSSKLMTLGVALACFEMRPGPMDQNTFGVAMPYAEPTRYTTSLEALRSSKPELASMVLTGEAYR